MNTHSLELHLSGGPKIPYREGGIREKSREGGRGGGGRGGGGRGGREVLLKKQEEFG